MYFQALFKLTTFTGHVCACNSLRIITPFFSDSKQPSQSQQFPHMFSQSFFYFLVSQTVDEG